MSRVEPPELPAAAPKPYEEPRIGQRGVAATGFSVMSLVAGLGWGVAVPGVCSVLCASAQLGTVRTAIVVTLACVLTGFGLIRVTKHYVTHERIALLAGYAIAAGLTSPFIIESFPS